LLHAKVKVSKRGGVIDFVYNDGKTEWTDGSTGIQEINATTGEVFGKKVDIYTPNGLLLMHTDAFSGNESLTPGLYIIRTADGQSVKMAFPAK
jgi:hypothetical protein